MNNAMITIGMPVFNDVDFIEKSIETIINQTYRNWKLIISDDGSTDGSDVLCKRIAASDNRINYIRQPANLGISKNMEYLLTYADKEFFMWAGDDDLYHHAYIEKCVSALESNPDAVVAFTSFALINENGKTITKPQNYDYSNSNRTVRLRHFIRHSTDYFGYGVFRSRAIKDVKFPVWWWPNKKSPYNNIYPTLCYYLIKGDYVHAFSEKPFFLKRVKTGTQVNHVLTGEHNAIKESFAFWIRKFNLICFTTRQIARASNVFFCIRFLPDLFYYWFLVPSWKQFLLAFRSFFKNRLTK